MQVKFQGHGRREGTICFPGPGEGISLSGNTVLIYLLEGHNERQSNKCQGIACSQSYCRKRRKTLQEGEE